MGCVVSFRDVCERDVSKHKTYVCVFVGGCEREKGGDRSVGCVLEM